MRSISELLKSHRLPGVRLSEIRNTCAKVAENLTSHAITAKQVQYKNGTVFFKVPSVIKTELLLREDDFKKTLQSLGIKVAGVR